MTLNEEVFDVDLEKFYVQAVTVPNFKNLTLNNACISPPAYDVFKYIGGVLIFKVFNKFRMEKSQIDLTECGIPVAKKMKLRPLTEQEMNGETDKSARAGEENYMTAERLILNSGDGAVFLMARDFISDEVSRIGNPKTYGRAQCRGAADSKFKPSDVTNIGGSTILIAAEQVLGFKSQVLGKYRSSDLKAGRGLSRCLIASNSLLADDEKLYSFDILQDDSRVQKLGVENFGSGTAEIVNPKYQLNNYAEISYRSGDDFYIKSKTLSGAASFKVGTLVLVLNELNEIRMTRLLGASLDKLTLKTGLTGERFKVVSVPEYKNLEITEAVEVEDFFAVAVSNEFKMSGSVRSGIKLGGGNSQSWNKSGGIFILAKELKLGENARLSAAMVIAGSVVGLSEEVFVGKPNFVYSC